MKTCRTCVLDENFPGVALDDEGICHYCREARTADLRREQKEKYRKRFLALVGRIKGRTAYDCLAAFSGGKDSAYTLHLLKNIHGLKVLAFHFDNWFQSERARRNTREVARHLGIDLITLLPNFQDLKRIFSTALSEPLYSAKSLERASTLCTTCLALIRFAGLRMAIEKRIPLLAFGLSPGQAPPVTSIVKTNPDMIRTMQEAIVKPLDRHLGNLVRPYFLEARHYEIEDGFPHIVNLLAFSDYREDIILQTLEGSGWVKPDDTDPNSTNCRLNALATRMHSLRYGYNPYAFEIAELVRSGALSREAGLEKLHGPLSEPQVREAARKLEVELPSDAE